VITASNAAISTPALAEVVLIGVIRAGEICPLEEGSKRLSNRRL